jgi:hypothetical protein
MPWAGDPAALRHRTENITHRMTGGDDRRWSRLTRDASGARAASRDGVAMPDGDACVEPGTWMRSSAHRGWLEDGMTSDLKQWCGV